MEFPLVVIIKQRGFSLSPPLSFSLSPNSSRARERENSSIDGGTRSTPLLRRSSQRVRCFPPHETDGTFSLFFYLFLSLSLSQNLHHQTLRIQLVAISLILIIRTTTFQSNSSLLILYRTVERSRCIVLFPLLDALRMKLFLQGWQEGEGLGKDKQGIKGHLRVKNKQDTTGFFSFFLPTAANVIYNICAVQMFNMCLCFPLIGVGLDKAANNWAFDTSQFDNILKRLKVVTL